MHKLRILKNILSRTHADRMLYSYVLFILAAACIIWLAEPDIQRYSDALWYCYAVLTTVGFGDILVTTFIGRVISVLLSIYSVLVIAIVTGVVVNYYTQLIQIQQEKTIASVVNRLEHLPELPKEELEKVADHVKNFHKNHPNL